MISRRFMLHRDYYMLPTSRVLTGEHSHHPRCKLGTLLWINNTEIPFVTDIMI